MSEYPKLYLPDILRLSLVAAFAASLATALFFVLFQLFDRPSVGTILTQMVVGFSTGLIFVAPFNIGMTMIGVYLARRHQWARHWRAWIVIGFCAGVIFCLITALFISIFNGYELGGFIFLMAICAALIGAFASIMMRYFARYYISGV
ncbi:MAG: hypothetical protein AAGH53_13030 [Pseudomonadota bacterium]